MHATADNIIEVFLPGKLASARQIARAVNRHAKASNLCSVEVRYSTNSKTPTTPDEIKSALKKFSEHAGFRRVKVSIRRHENEFDNVGGAHVLRLVHEGAPRSTASSMQSMVIRHLPEWLQTAFGLTLIATSAKTSSSMNSHARIEPTIQRATAVEALQRALGLACTAHIANGTAATSAPCAATVTVRSKPLHQALSALATDQAALTQWLQRGMTNRHVAAAPGFTATYRFDSHNDGDGTTYMMAGDVEVTFVSASRNTKPPSFEIDDGTLLPGMPPMPNTSASPITQIEISVVAIGTTPLPSPFVMTATLPAKIDRTFFVGSPFATAHPDLLATISRQQALTIDRDGNRWTLACGIHPATGVAACYLDDTTSTPVTQGLSTSAATPRVMLNVPTGVNDPRTGRTIPPVVIELRLVSAKWSVVDPDATLLPH